ncbi:efflux RND transporter periplasmic adaptor subunit [Oceanispirochaeta sp. M1]|nr:efflux RND transporter periplasmic adaptor subunit [Oceanispirochaeta sp. M1]
MVQGYNLHQSRSFQLLQKWGIPVCNFGEFALQLRPISVCNKHASHLQADQAHLDWLNSKGALLDAEEIMEEAFCISPFDGTVLAINIREFEKLIPGDETFVIEDQSRMRITIGIPEGEMSGISEGNPADVTFSSCPGRSWEGTLLSYSRESSDQNLTYKAEIEVDNPDGAIMSGTTARVKLLRNIYEEKLVIPVETIRILGNKSYAMAVEDNTIVSREITAGPSDSRNVIILSGLKEGDRIVKEGIHLVNNGSSVKVMD